jgi:chromosome segregation ATPase
MNYMQRAFDGAEPEPIVELQSTFDAHIEADHLRAEVERLTRECGDLRERIRIAMSALSVASARAVNAEAERDDWMRATHDVRQALARAEDECNDLLAIKVRVAALAAVWRKGETRHITTRLVASLLRSAMK